MPRHWEGRTLLRAKRHGKITSVIHGSPIGIMDIAVKLPTLIWFDILSLHKYNDGFGFVYSRIKFGF